MSTLGNRIKLVRGAETQEAFAARIGISKGAIGGYERDANSPSADVVLKICSGANISVEWLMTGRGSMQPGERQSTSPPQPDQIQPSETASTIPCTRCEKLEAKLEKVENQRDELADENRRLLKENGLLREENATLRERQRKEQASPFDERRHIPSSDDVLQNRPPVCK